MNIIDQIEAMASNDQPHLQKFAVTGEFLRAVHAKLQELKAAASERRICDCCEMGTPAFQIPDGCNAPGYMALEQARVDRLGAADEAAAGMRQ